MLKQQNQQISEYEEIIAELNLKVSQLDVYKQQVVNLQHQIQVLDEKFKLTQYDSDNFSKTHQFQELEVKVNHSIERERILNNTVDAKEEEVKTLIRYNPFRSNT